PRRAPPIDRPDRRFMCDGRSRHPVQIAKASFDRGLAILIERRIGDGEKESGVDVEEANRSRAGETGARATNPGPPRRGNHAINVRAHSFSASTPRGGGADSGVWMIAQRRPQTPRSAASSRRSAAEVVG